MNSKEKKYIDRLIAIPWGWNDFYKIGFITPENYRKLNEILSEIRSDKSQSWDDWVVMSNIYKAYYRKYFEIKELIHQEPRLHAQKFIGKKNIRKFIFQRDGNKCLCCGDTKYLTIDHILPIYHEGKNELSNLQTLCKSCNSRKSTQYKDYR